MQVKIFEGEDMASTLKKVREALGSDALILSTKTVRKGGLGILGKPMVEITAAVDDPVASSWVSRSFGVPTRSAAQKTARPAATSAEEDLTYDTLWQEQPPQRQKPLQRQREKTGERVEKTDSAGLSMIHSDLDAIKHLLQDLSSRVDKPPRSLPPIVLPETEKHDSRIKKILRTLEKSGIRTGAAEQIIGDVLRGGPSGEDDQSQEVLVRSIADHIRVSGSIEITPGTQKRVALIGPTGVGKTTTIAKLAAAHLAAGGGKVALITIDTYRIAAVEQLKVYGEIMRLPVEVVITPEQLPQMLARHADKELILIDTAGRSPRDDIRIQELASYLTPELDIECQLVLAANTREEDLGDTVRRFGILSPASIIFTKIDECSVFGSIFTVASSTGYPLSYLTNGQRVPEDLLLADPDKISRLIMSGRYDGDLADMPAMAGINTQNRYKEYHEGDLA